MTKVLALWAFETLLRRLFPDAPKSPLSKFGELTGIPKEAPLFITWNKDGDLRGCIGTFLALPTEKGVAEYAIVSAFEDPRFSPISEKELGSLSVSVTLLDNFTVIEDASAWKIGLHGLRVRFSQLGRNFSGTFLPSVAEEQGWDIETTLYYLARKAGYHGVAQGHALKTYQAGIDEGWIQLTRYDGVKGCADFADYKEAKGL